MSIHEMYGKQVLITGASAGIGKAIAEEYAKYGADLILVARRLERLETIAEELNTKYGSKVYPVQADLADVDAPQKIFDEVKSHDIDVDILVNNAGYGVPGRYLDEYWKVHAAFNQVMVTAVMHLTHLFLPAMVEQKFGRIINIASLAGHMPGSEGHTAYAAVKSWMIRFTESLHFEYGRDGVNATAICPGFTYSEFHDVTGTRDEVSKMGKHMWMTSEEVAQQTLEASEAGKVVYVNGWVNKAIAVLPKILPRKLQYALMKSQSKKFRKLD